MILLHLVNGIEHKVECIHTLSVARVFWFEWVTESPAVGHGEEMCEALLSCLVSDLHSLQCVDILESARDAFFNIKLADNHIKQLQSLKIGHANLLQVE